jgi:hypothetical protein
VAILLSAVAILATLPPATITMITWAPVLSRWPQMTRVSGRRP